MGESHKDETGVDGRGRCGVGRTWVPAEEDSELDVGVAMDVAAAIDDDDVGVAVVAVEHLLFVYSNLILIVLSLPMLVCASHRQRHFRPGWFDHRYVPVEVDADRYADHASPW